MTLRRKKTRVTSPAILLAAAIGGIVHVRPDAEPRTKYADRPRDFVTMGAVKADPCCAPRFADLLLLRYGVDARVAIGDCDGEVEADHAGYRGKGRKSADVKCLPKCVRHHRLPGLLSLLYGLLPVGAYRAITDELLDERAAVAA